MATFGESKPSGSVEEYDMGHNAVERVHGDALGGTSHDAQDMYRMGKKQELRVRRLQISHLQLTDASIEKLPHGLHHRVCCRSSVDMGERLAVSTEINAMYES